MRAITLKHPWPFAIAHLGKRIENRGWAPHPRQLAPGEVFAIHGGAVPRYETDWLDVASIASDLFARFGRPAGMEHIPTKDLVLPGIVAVATFGGVLRKSDDPWFQGPCGWVLEGVRTFLPPIRCPGAQGLWTVPPRVLAELEARLPVPRAY